MNTELAVIESEYLDPFNEDEQSQVEANIEIILDSISKHEISLSTSYVQLGLLLLQAQKGRYWRGYSSFARYLGYIEERIGRARSQIYAYVCVAERLTPYISNANLEKMGISKAQELVRYVKQSGLSVPQNLLTDALDPKVKLGKLHINVSEALHVKGEVRGTWYEPLGGFYALPDEKKEIQQAFDKARQVDPPISSDLPDHVQRLEIILRLCREFVSSYPEV